MQHYTMVAHVIQDPQILTEKYGTSTTITNTKIQTNHKFERKNRWCINQHGENHAVPSTIHNKTELFAAHKFTQF